MRLRPTRCHARVTAHPGGDRPITVTLAPGMVYELAVAEARQLALDLADAIEEHQRDGDRR